MPIYEFYCDPCHTVFQFFSRSVNTTKTPPCPRCHAGKMSREVSLFALTGKAKKPGDVEDLPVDETKMERAMMTLAAEAESMDENDPRQAAQLMRRMSEMTGMPLGGSMQEAISRMESGEDPDTVERDMGELLDQDEWENITKNHHSIAAAHARSRPPKHDDTLYDL